MYKQGDIILVPFPFTDLTQTKVRPAVVLSNSSVAASNDFIIAQITTQPIRGPFVLELSNADVTIPFKAPHHRQYVYCKKLATIERSIIHKRITSIKDGATLVKLLEKVKSVFDKD